MVIFIFGLRSTALSCFFPAGSPKRTWKFEKILLLLLTIITTEAFSILKQTEEDSRQLEDALTHFFETTNNKPLPMLLAPPQPYFKESDTDFVDVITNVVSKSLFRLTPKGEFIFCGECAGGKVMISPQKWLIYHAGELSLIEIQNLVAQNQNYAKAHSVMFIKESPSGIITKIVSLQSGEILFHHIADSSKTLDDVQPFLHYSKEKLRRQQNLPLTHVQMHFGFINSFSLGLSFLEQWGEYNQHVSGLAISFAGPTLGFGPSYHFLFRDYPKTEIGVNLLMTPAGVINGGGGLLNQVTLQAIGSYALGNNYGVIVGASVGGSTQIFTGFAFYNPIFLPFLL